MPRENLKDKLYGNELDLGLSNLITVPVKELAALPKGTHLDLSCNLLTDLPETFCSLTHLVKIDLSKNLLASLPDDFGNLTRLLHLDLLGNKLTVLPVSMHQLKSLKWLDLKDNPLVPELRKVAGDCLDEAQCKKCAIDVVAHMKIEHNQIQKKIQIQREAENITHKAAAVKQPKKHQQQDADCRSPGVLAAVQLYVKTMCQKLGFQKKGLKVHDNMSQGSDNMKLREILDNTVKFRHNVRQFALTQQIPKKDFDNPREYKKCRQNVFLPLLQECDNLRSQLSLCQIRLQDHAGFSSWEFDDTKNTGERAESGPDITAETSKTQDVHNSCSQSTSAEEVASKSLNDQGQPKSKLTSTDKYSSDSDRTSGKCSINK